MIKKKITIKTKKILSLSIILFSFILMLYIMIFPKSDGNIFSHLWPRHKSDFDAAFDFAHALRNSDISVYELADQNLWPQIDQWMETHKNEICVREVDEIVLVEKQNDGKIDVSIPCFLENGSQYKFEIVGIEVQNRNNEFYVKSWEAIVEQ